MGCQNPSCDHKDHDTLLYLSPKCHPGKPVFVRYDKAYECLDIFCSVCDHPITSVAVKQ
jgi:hypothetical protein